MADDSRSASGTEESSSSTSSVNAGATSTAQSSSNAASHTFSEIELLNSKNPQIGRYFFESRSDSSSSSHVAYPLDLLEGFESEEAKIVWLKNIDLSNAETIRLLTPNQKEVLRAICNNIDLLYRDWLRGIEIAGIEPSTRYPTPLPEESKVKVIDIKESAALGSWEEASTDQNTVKIYGNTVNALNLYKAMIEKTSSPRIVDNFLNGYEQPHVFMHVSAPVFAEISNCLPDLSESQQQVITINEKEITHEVSATLKNKKFLSKGGEVSDLPGKPTLYVKETCTADKPLALDPTSFRVSAADEATLNHLKNIVLLDTSKAADIDMKAWVTGLHIYKFDEDKISEFQNAQLANYLNYEKKHHPPAESSSSSSTFNSEDEERMTLLKNDEWLLSLDLTDEDQVNNLSSIQKQIVREKIQSANPLYTDWRRNQQPQIAGIAYIQTTVPTDIDTFFEQDFNKPSTDPLAIPMLTDESSFESIQLTDDFSISPHNLNVFNLYKALRQKFSPALVEKFLPEYEQEGIPFALFSEPTIIEAGYSFDPTQNRRQIIYFEEDKVTYETSMDIAFTDSQEPNPSARLFTPPGTPALYVKRVCTLEKPTTWTELAITSSDPTQFENLKGFIQGKSAATKNLIQGWFPRSQISAIAAQTAAIKNLQTARNHLASSLAVTGLGGFGLVAGAAVAVVTLAIAAPALTVAAVAALPAVATVAAGVGVAAAAVGGVALVGGLISTAINWYKAYKIQRGISESYQRLQAAPVQQPELVPETKPTTVENKLDADTGLQATPSNKSSTSTTSSPADDDDALSFKDQRSASAPGSALTSAAVGSIADKTADREKASVEKPRNR